MKLHDLDGLIAFLKVASTRNFTEAARSFGVTRSAISQTVSRLEERLGVPLLHRTTRSIGLTEAGEQFLANSSQLIETVLSNMDALREFGGDPAGRLKINVPRIALPIVIEPILREFAMTYPKVSIEIVVDDGLVDLPVNSFDAGVRLGEMVEADMIGVQVTSPLKLAVVGSPDYFARHGRPAVPEDLKQHRCIQFRGASRGELYRWEFERDGKEFQVAVDGQIVVNESSSKILAAVNGLGLAYELDILVEPFVRNGQLERVLEEAAPTSPGFYLYYPSRAQARPALKAFVNAIRRVGVRKSR